MTCSTRKVRDLFIPNYKERILTEKFYARHDVLAANAEKVKFYIKELEKREQINLHSTYAVPITENQVYGWLEQHSFKYTDEFDRDILCRERKTDEEIKLMQEIAQKVHRNRAIR